MMMQPAAVPFDELPSAVIEVPTETPRSNHAATVGWWGVLGIILAILVFDLWLYKSGRTDLSERMHKLDLSLRALIFALCFVGLWHVFFGLPGWLTKIFHHS
jgi:hypothetical protein